VVEERALLADTLVIVQFKRSDGARKARYDREILHSNAK